MMDDFREEGAGASREERAAETQCAWHAEHSYCEPNFCGCACVKAAPPAPETPPRPASRDLMGFTHPPIPDLRVPQTPTTGVNAMLGALPDMPEAQPNAESAAGQEDQAQWLAERIYEAAMLADPCKIPCPGIDQMKPLIEAVMRAEAQALRERCAALADLLRRIHGWDHMDVAGDGAFWRREIEAALSGGGGPSK